jgi:hypothetical protein
MALPRKAIGLLAYLATHQDPQPRDRLIELLWPERDPAAGRKDMRNTLWTVRQALGSEAIASESGSLALGKDTWVDVHEFARGASPDLYRGPFLDALYFDDAPDFEQWLANEQTHWQERYQTLCAGTWRAEAAPGFSRATVDPLTLNLNVFHQVLPAPYVSPSAPRLLATGWDLEEQGALAEAAAIFEEVYYAARGANLELASHCCLEMAVVRLLEDAPDEVEQWLARAGEPKVGDLLSQRLRNSIATVLDVHHSDHQTAHWFMHQYVLQWRNTARCTLLQALLARGDLDSEMEAVLARLTATAH